MDVGSILILILFTKSDNSSFVYVCGAREHISYIILYIRGKLSLSCSLMIHSYNSDQESAYLKMANQRGPNL